MSADKVRQAPMSKSRDEGWPCLRDADAKRGMHNVFVRSALSRIRCTGEALDHCLIGCRVQMAHKQLLSCCFCDACSSQVSSDRQAHGLQQRIVHGCVRFVRWILSIRRI